MTTHLKNNNRFKSIGKLVVLVLVTLFNLSCSKDEEVVPKSNLIQLTKELYRQVDQNPQNKTALAGLFSEQYVDNEDIGGATITDKDAILNLFYALAEGFPNQKHRLDIVETIGTDKVVVYWTFTGTHKGNFFGQPATNKSVKINGIDILRFENGKIIEQWHVEELQALFQQITP
jgi:steroid delta-isomerase-like uncharacterized protein